jgi:NAD(P)-dependent dehydrogenase (short-subunit alcohol dehydrogenase family)
MELRGKTAIITGSSAGIGRATAVEFARQGANVVCCARRENKLRETVDMIEKSGGRAAAVVADITEKDQVDNVVATALERFGQIDVLYNNAAAFAAIGALWEVDIDVWWRDITINVLGPALFCRAVLPHMMERNSGLIINMDGGGSSAPFPGATGYGSSKAALMRLTDTLARELEHDGYDIYVVGMGPGSVYTEIWEPQLNTPAGKKWIGELRAIVDEKRYMPPERCATASVELIRIMCPEINGCLFGVNTDFAQIARQAKEIRAQDAYQIRMRKPTSG